MAQLTCLELERADYQTALHLQLRLARQVWAADNDDAYLLVLEHDPPVITLGRRGRDEDILVSPEELAAAGLEVHRTTRGGEATFHGPGQLVGYPILALRRHRLTVRDYVHMLEETLSRLLARFGLVGQRREGASGVWVGARKIAAIGIALTRWVTYHGFALNVSSDLSGFDWIVPCGAPDQRMTSIEQLTGGQVILSQVTDALVARFAETFDFASVKREVWPRGHGGGQGAWDSP